MFSRSCPSLTRTCPLPLYCFRHGRGGRRRDDVFHGSLPLCQGPWFRLPGIFPAGGRPFPSIAGAGEDRATVLDCKMAAAQSHVVPLLAILHFIFPGDRVLCTQRSTGSFITLDLFDWSEIQLGCSGVVLLRGRWSLWCSQNSASAEFIPFVLCMCRTTRGRTMVSLW